jgi:hypothetical protein
VTPGHRGEDTKGSQAHGQRADRGGNWP